MFYIRKRLEISASHHLDLSYPSKCTRVHGHNWIIDVFCRSAELDDAGMVMDFTEIKEKISDVLDHQDLNAVLPCNPTSENLALWIARAIGPKCYKVMVQESEGNIACYEADDAGCRDL
ncbi:MAG: 6-carboxytetrahydropterin synthase [Desulfovibrionaceae bacterium]|nr:6-carboxytetrahydropterin synthase [Desulfovibrionaceae bacterium]